MSKKKATKRKRGAAVRSSELVMLRRAELELHCGIANMRSLIDQLNGMQQIWARAADALKAAQHNDLTELSARVTPTAHNNPKI